MSPSAVPTPLSPLVGREGALAELRELLGQARLVSLTGAGGSGKTRLAIELVSRETAARGGAAGWVELASLAEEHLLADHVATAVGVRLGPAQGATAALVATLAARPYLLAVDNCEHLVEPVARLVEILLRGCPQLQILLTSREPLGVPGERIWPVPPLSLPEGNGDGSLVAARAAEAVQLFTERAREAHPGFALTEENRAAVVAICRRLDGLPLALELAAARTRALAVEEIARRLDDAFGLLTTGPRTSLLRHKTLRGAFDWSHGLLTQAQRALLRRLTVFAGSFSLEAVEEICPGGDLGPAEVLDVLAALVDRSLVVFEPDADRARYRLLETVRQYGREHLRSAGEEPALRRRHAELFLRFAEERAPALFGGAGPPALMRRLDLEHDNLRAAAEWTLSEDDRGETALRLGIALHWYWFARGTMEEGHRHLAAALERGGSAPPAVRGRAVAAFGLMALALGRPESAAERLEEATELLRREGDAADLAYALALFGALSLPAEPMAASRALLEAAALVKPLPPSVLHPFVAYYEGTTAYLTGDRARARTALEGGLAISRRLGHLPAIAHSLFALARVEQDDGQGEAAHRLLVESLLLHAETGDRWGLVKGLEQLARLASAGGDARRGVRLLAAARRLGGEVGIVETDAEAAELEQLALGFRAALGDAEYDTGVAEGGRMSSEDLPGFLRQRTAADGVGPPAAAERPAAPPVLSTSAEAGSPAVAKAAAPGPAADSAAEGTARATLEVAALGPLRIRRETPEGADAAGDGWSGARTRELLVFLLLHPEGATKEEVGLALWPEASTSQVRNSFHVTLHRLRKALGESEGIRVEAGRYRLAPGLVAGFDVPAFEGEARSALTALRKGDRGEALDALLAALARYRGELLEGEPAGEWHLERRDRLQLLFLECLAAAGRALEADRRFPEAAEIYRRWIRADDLAEEAYRRLMACLGEIGDTPEAERVYHRLVKILGKELDVEPEPETREIFERLQPASRAAR